MYKLLKQIDGTILSDVVKRTTDNTHIPFDEANADYQAYLAWLAEGNTPEAAE